MKKSMLILIIVSILGFIPSVSAGLISDDTSALITGSVDYVSELGMTSTVHYAVFEPGTFGGIDVLAGYVYAYQIENTAPSGAVTLFSVNLLPDSGAVTAGTNDGYNGGTTAMYTSANYSSESFIASFSALPVVSGGHSEVALFTSPYSYSLEVSSLSFSGGQSAQVNALMPTPVPEPATISLLGLAGLVLFRKRRNK